MTITVNPVAVADKYTVNAGTPLSTTAATGILSNDQGSTLTKNSLVTGPAYGSLTLNADGSFTYTANAASAARTRSRTMIAKQAADLQHGQRRSR